MVVFVLALMAVQVFTCYLSVHRVEIISTVRVGPCKNILWLSTILNSVSVAVKLPHVSL